MTLRSRFSWQYLARHRSETGFHTSVCTTATSQSHEQRDFISVKCWRDASQRNWGECGHTRTTTDGNSLVAVVLSALKACSISCDIESGKKIHLQASGCGFYGSVYVENTLIDMYAKCGSMLDAQAVFDSMLSRNLVSWNALMQGYAVNGEGRIVLDLFSTMASQGCEPDARSFVAALMACSSLATNKQPGKYSSEKLINKQCCLEKGIGIHSQVVKSHCSSNIFVASALVDMYAKCGSIPHARAVFDGMQHRNVVSWTSLIQGYVENGDPESALQLFEQMQLQGVEPNCRTFVAALMACASIGADGNFSKASCLDKGVAIHSQLLKAGFGSDIFLASALVDMYAKCGSMVKACNVFEAMQRRDVVLWNAVIVGCVENGDYESALAFLDRMQSAAAGCKPDGRTYVAALMACSNLAAKEDSLKLEWLKKGIAIHAQAVENGYSADVFIASSLVEMYAKCGKMAEARSVFQKMKQKDLVLWNSLMLGYVQNGEGEVALELLGSMESEGCQADARTFVAAAMACASMAVKEEEKDVASRLMKVESLEKGMALHCEADKRGYVSDFFVASSLVDMYAKCGSMVDAQLVFDRMQHHDVVIWTALILGYAENGEGETALELLSVMQSQGCSPNSRTYVAALVACGVLAVLQTGKAYHAEICKQGLENGNYVGNALVDFYGKCGSLADAQRVFDSMAATKAVTWSTLLACYSRQGDTDKVFELFSRMHKEGLKADGVTFISILSACSHAGLVEKGRWYFEAMKAKYGVEPDIGHYHSVVDLLGRANRLADAVEMVEKMPFRANFVSWMTVLAACRKWKNVEIGRVAFERVLDANDKAEAGYVLMANLYGSLGMWEEQLRVLELKEAARKR